MNHGSRAGSFRQVGTAEQRAGGHVVPAPLAGLPEEDQQRADVAVTGPGRQGPSVTRVDAVVQVREVGLDVVTGQSGQAGDLGVSAGQQGQQVAEGVPGAAHRLGPVGGLQRARQPPVDRRGDRGWGAGRHRLLFPDHVAAQTVIGSRGIWPVLNNSTCRASAGPALLLEQRGQDGGVVDAPGAVHVAGPDERRFGKGAPAADFLTERGQVLVGDRGDVRIAPPEEEPGDGPGQRGPAVPVAEWRCR